MSQSPWKQDKDFFFLFHSNISSGAFSFWKCFVWVKKEKDEAESQRLVLCVDWGNNRSTIGKLWFEHFIALKSRQAQPRVCLSPWQPWCHMCVCERDPPVVWVSCLSVYFCTCIYWVSFQHTWAPSAAVSSNTSTSPCIWIVSFFGVMSVFLYLLWVQIEKTSW